MESLEENLHVGHTPQSAVLRPLKSDFVVMYGTVRGNLQHIGNHESEIAIMIVMQFLCAWMRPISRPEGTACRAWYGEPYDSIPPRDQPERIKDCSKAGGSTKVTGFFSESVCDYRFSELRVGKPRSLRTANLQEVDLME